MAAKPDEQELTLLKLIDAEYTRHPFYGSRKIRQYLPSLGYKINRKRVQRLMGILGLAGMAPGPDTSRPHPQHKLYPYLLRGVDVIRPNQLWSTDMTYIRLAHGFVYLVAVIDWYSRKVLSWRLSNTLDSGFCVDCLEQALQAYGTPEIFNTDQGASLPAKLLLACSRRTTLPSAWMGVAGHRITSLWNGFGVTSTTKTCIRKVTPQCPNC